MRAHAKGCGEFVMSQRSLRDSCKYFVLCILAMFYAGYKKHQLFKKYCFPYMLEIAAKQKGCYNTNSCSCPYLNIN